MKEFVLDDLRIDLTLMPNRIRLDWYGTSRLPDEGVLTPFLSRVARDAAKGRASLEIHIERMAAFNSTTIGAVIRFVKTLQDQDIGLEFVFDPRQRWQKIFADTVSLFDKKDGRLKLQPAAQR